MELMPRSDAPMIHIPPDIQRDIDDLAKNNQAKWEEMLNEIEQLQWWCRKEIAKCVQLYCGQWVGMTRKNPNQKEQNHGSQTEQ